MFINLIVVNLISNPLLEISNNSNPLLLVTNSKCHY